MQYMYKKRIITERLRKLTHNFPVVVVSGARQVGKSTVLQHTFPDMKAVVFDPVNDVGGAKSSPDIFLDNNPAPLILDEIQYAPQLTASIKRRVDAQKKNNMYIITGSQQWSVMKNIAESLAGRAVFIDLGGFTLSEIAQQTDAKSWLERWLENPDEFIKNPSQRLKLTRTLYQQLWRGWLPKADSLDEDLLQTYYRSYMHTYLERDARMIADISALDELGKFTQLASALTAQEINYSQLGRDIAITPQTAKRWFNVLRATFQVFEVPAYSGNTLKRISGKAKGYIADTGLACMLNAISTPTALGGHPMTGALFETAVVGQIRNLITILPTTAMYHWRSHKTEVDLLLERDGRLFPIEVKLTAHPTKKDTAGIDAFRRTYPNCKIAPGLIISPCTEFMKISENDYALPWDTM
jgi:predicted AAA+ superfamily ATPase